VRPVDKGESPYKIIKKYQDALPYLEEKIGLYCSYCEASIQHVPEVEHMISKKSGGDWTAWSNLLLGCKYCNTRKLDQVTPQNVEEYLWPDSDNTALAFSYTNGFPEVNEDTLNELDPTGSSCEKAKNTYKLVGLGNLPDIEKGDRDRRALERNRAFHRALASLKLWSNVKDAPESYKSGMKEQMMMTAAAVGFFSVWMTVFSDEPQILQALIEKFSGTDKSYYDGNGKVKKILKKESKVST